MTTPLDDSAAAYLRRTSRTARVAKYVAFAVLGLAVISIVLALVNVGIASQKVSQLSGLLPRTTSDLNAAQQADKDAQTTLAQTESDYEAKSFQAYLVDPSVRFNPADEASDPTVRAAYEAASKADTDLLVAKGARALLDVEVAKAQAAVSNDWPIVVVVGAISLVVAGTVAAIAFGLSTSAMKARATMQQPTAPM